MDLLAQKKSIDEQIDELFNGQGANLKEKGPKKTQSKKIKSAPERRVKKNWTDMDQREFERLHGKGLATREIAKEMGMSVTCIYNKRKKMVGSPKSDKNGFRSADQIDNIKAEEYECIDCGEKIKSKLPTNEVKCPKNENHKIVQK